MSKHFNQLVDLIQYESGLKLDQKRREVIRITQPKVCFFHPNSVSRASCKFDRCQRDNKRDWVILESMWDRWDVPLAQQEEWKAQYKWDSEEEENKRQATFNCRCVIDPGHVREGVGRNVSGE